MTEDFAPDYNLLKLKPLLDACSMVLDASSLLLQNRAHLADEELSDGTVAACDELATIHDGLMDAVDQVLAFVRHEVDARHAIRKAG